MLSPSPTKDIVAIHPGPHGSAGHRGFPSRNVRRLLLWGGASVALLALVALVLFLPFHFPSVVNTFANITAANKWILEKGPAGQLIARSFNYQTGMSDGYRVSNFDSGSSIFFSVSPALKPGMHVVVGDTIGTVYSSEMQERLISLNGQLAAAEGQLAVNATGAKSAVVEAARQRLQSAKRRREDYQATVTRTQQLFDDHLLPQGEYDRVQSTVHNLDDAIAIEQADLEAAQSGAKPEELALAQSHIAALKDEISAISSRAATYTLRAPIDGTISSTYTGETLLTILATSHYVAIMPIRWSDYRRVVLTPNARVTIAGFSRPVQGRILSLNREVEVHAGQKVVMATALLDSPPYDLLPGSTARCRIECRSLTAAEHGKLFLHSIATAVDLGGSF
jgi:hypothetical protein